MVKSLSGRISPGYIYNVKINTTFLVDRIQTGNRSAQVFDEGLINPAKKKEKKKTDFLTGAESIRRKCISFEGRRRKDGVPNNAPA